MEDQNMSGQTVLELIQEWANKARPLRPCGA